MSKKTLLTLTGSLAILAGAAYYGANFVSANDSPSTSKQAGKTHQVLLEEKTKREMNALLQKIFPHDAKAWLDLLEATKLLSQLSHTSQQTKNTSQLALLESLNTLLQEAWLRKPNLERWHLSDDALSAEKKKNIAEALNEMHIYGTIEPIKIDNHYRQYDCALLMGALESRVHLRLNYLLDLWKKGLKFNRLFVLTGSRSLDPAQEPITATLAALKIDTTEEEMTGYLLKTALKERSKTDPAFQNFEREVEIIHMNAPAKPDATRANATDVITKWKDQYDNSANRNILLIANQPYIPYYAGVLTRILSHDFSDPVQSLAKTYTHFKLANGTEIEAIGEKSTAGIMVTLDHLARFFYQYLPLFRKELNEKPSL